MGKEGKITREQWKRVSCCHWCWWWRRRRRRCGDLKLILSQVFLVLWLRKGGSRTRHETRARKFFDLKALSRIRNKSPSSSGGIYSLSMSCINIIVINDPCSVYETFLPNWKPKKNFISDSPSSWSIHTHTKRSISIWRIMSIEFQMSPL